MEKLILENENRIQQFDLNFYIGRKKYPVAAALAALETTNEIQKCYFNKEETEDVSENVLNLYAFLQSLFVSIDSLYALAYSLTKSKSFININRNPELRDLKYIRNDVVGHPANRVLNSNTLAYCILDNSSVTKYTFAYDVYSGEGKEQRIIDINAISNAYYKECNDLLAELFQIAKENKRVSSLVNLAIDAIDSYSMRGDYYSVLCNLKEEYLANFSDASANQHRIIWRLELIDTLRKYENEDEEISELVEYSIGLEIVRIYQLLSGKLYKQTTGRRTPKILSLTYRFFNKNKGSSAYLEKITDIKNPIFNSAINYLLDLAKRRNTVGPIKYFSLLKELYLNGEDDLVFALTVPLKEYRRNR